MSKIFPNTTMPELLNAVREKAGLAYKEEVPYATDANIQYIGDLIAGNRDLANKFTDVLIDKVALQTLHNRRYKNPLQPLHKGMLPPGRVIEDMIVDIPKVVDFDPEAETLLKNVPPDIKACYHTKLEKKKTASSIRREDLAMAFTSMDAMERMIDAVIVSMHNAMEKYDRDTIIDMIGTGVKSKNFVPVYVPKITDKTTADYAIQKIKEVVLNMLNFDDDYNMARVNTFAALEDIVLVLDTKSKVALDVLSLTSFFNIEYGMFTQSQNIVIRDFGPAARDYGVWGWVGDKNVFQIYDKLYETGEPFWNTETLTRKYFLHKWTMYAIQPFCKGAVLVDKEPVVQSFTLTPDTTSVGHGDSAKFTVLVDGTGALNAMSDFTVTGGQSKKTVIDKYGVLTVGADETASTLTVTATSLIYAEKTATATVTVTE